MNIEQEMPPWGPRYDPIWPTAHGMGTTEVHDYSECEHHDWKRKCLSAGSFEFMEVVIVCEKCGWEWEEGMD